MQTTSKVAMFGIQALLISKKENRMFRTQLTPAFAIAALGLIASLSTPALAETPDARIEKSLPAFTSVDLEGVGDLEIRQGDKESLVIEGPQDTVNEVQARVRGGKLSIGLDEDWKGMHWKLFGRERRHGLRYVLTVKTLKSIETSGAGSVHAEGFSGDSLSIESSGATSITLTNLKLKRLDLDSSGASKVTLTGSVDEQHVELSGACKYEGRQLQSRVATLEISGAGKAEVRASESLKAEISGVGKIDYYGSPKVTQDISGIGRIRRAGD
jgi:hypothetical protein